MESPQKAIDIELVDVVGITESPARGARLKSAAVRVIGTDGQPVEFIVSARTIAQLDEAAIRVSGNPNYALNAEHVRSTVLMPEALLVIDDEL